MSKTISDYKPEPIQFKPKSITMKRVKSFGIYQTSKVSAIIFFFIALIFILPFGLFIKLTLGSNSPGIPFGGGIIFFLLPILYGVMGFIMTAISCFIYNLIAKWTGGIEIELEIVGESVDNTE
jgi:hypothetical protein